MVEFEHVVAAEAFSELLRTTSKCVNSLAEKAENLQFAENSRAVYLLGVGLRMEVDCLIEILQDKMDEHLSSLEE